MSLQPPPHPGENPYPPHGYQGAPYPPPAGGGPAGYPPPQGYGQQPPPNYYAAPPPPQPSRPPLVSIISPEDAKKIRKMQLINFAATLLQLGCSLAIILLVRNSLYRVTITQVPGSQFLMTTTCLAATPDQPGTCEYAYSLASISIMVGFILSLMQCLTMDCCGMGRAIEAGFDAAAAAWWIAGGITLGLRASEANAAGLPQASARNAVVALCWVSAAFFLILLCCNVVLIKRLGKAYKTAAQQMQQHLTATGYPQGGLQMGQMQMGGPPPGYPPQSTPPQHWGPAPAAAGAGAAGVGATAGQQVPQQPPAGYPAQFNPPAATTAGPTTGSNAV